MPKLHFDRHCDPEPNDCGEDIRERNGIWVVSINGVWRGDYIKREDAVAAVQDVQQNAHCAPR